jgi:phospho-N-acetylmuramoyl-pentapeptide-transferase
MLYYLFKFLDQQFDFPGAGLFNYISFRAAMAILLSLLISLVYGKYIIAFLRRKQIGETIRELGLAGENSKKGTPTMGGLIILSAIVVPTLLFAKLENVYVILMLITTVWLGFIGFMDDYIKVFKKDKRGLAGRFKIFGQVVLGVIVGGVLYFNSHVIIKEEISQGEVYKYSSNDISKITDDNGEVHYMKSEKAPVTTMPFIKNHEINYSSLDFLD